MNNSTSIILFGYNNQENQSIISELLHFKTDNLFSFNKKSEMVVFLSSNRSVIYNLLIDVNIDSEIGIDVIRTLLSLELKLNQISILYNAEAILDELINKVSFEFIYDRLKIDYIEKPFTKEKMNSFLNS